MLKKIVIEDFQSYKETSITISPYMTALTGLNNHGKSAIIKALWKIYRNEPDGSVFIRNKPARQKKTVITIENEAGVVKRVVKNDNSADANKYTYSSPGSEEEDEYVKFNTTIPEEIEKALSISPIIDFGGVKYDLNFHNQFDEEFLIVGKGLPSIRGKVLSKIMGVDPALKAIQLLRTDITRAEQKINRLKGEVKDKEEELLKYENVKEIEADVFNIKAKVKECSIIQTNVDSYNKLLVTLKNKIVEGRKLKRDIEVCSVNFGEKVDLISKITKIKSSLESVKLIQEKHKDLKDFIAICISAEKQGDLTKPKENVQILKKLKRLAEIKESIRNLEKGSSIELPEMKEILSLQKVLTGLGKVFDIQIAIDSINEALWENSEKLGNAEGDYNRLKKELGVCPLCKEPFDREHKH